MSKHFVTPLLAFGVALGCQSAGAQAQAQAQNPFMPITTAEGIPAAAAAIEDIRALVSSSAHRPPGAVTGISGAPGPAGSAQAAREMTAVLAARLGLDTVTVATASRVCEDASRPGGSVRCRFRDAHDIMTAFAPKLEGDTAEVRVRVTVLSGSFLRSTDYQVTVVRSNAGWRATDRRYLVSASLSSDPPRR